MKFGLFYEHQLPKPWDENSEERLLDESLDQIELADRLGFDYVWQVEHHFLEEYSHSSASEVFLGAVSQRTERIRLGFGIVSMSPQIQHPARVAEKVSTLDLLSKGRVEFGTGEGSSGVELDGFDIQRNSKREQWREAVEVATRMMVEQPFAGHDGQFIKVPQRNVVPKPRQKPHPPLWVACSRRDTIRMAARSGIGALSFSFIEPEQAREWVDEYYSIIESDQCKPIGFSKNPNFAVVVPMMCHEDEQTAIKRGIDGANFFGYSLAHYYIFGQHRPGFSDIYADYLKHRVEAGFAREIVEAKNEPLGIKMIREGFGSLRGAIGTPDQIEDLLRRYQEAGVDQVIFTMQAGNNKHQDICEAIELFAECVLPKFAGEDPNRQRRQRILSTPVPAKTHYPQADPTLVVKPLASGEGSPQAAATDKKTLIARYREQLVKGLLTKAVVHRKGRYVKRLLGLQVTQRLLLKLLCYGYQPQRSVSFFGKRIRYVVGGSNQSAHRWDITLSSTAATVASGGSGPADLTVTVGGSELLLLVCGIISPSEALASGAISVEGGIDLVQGLDDIFIVS